jgi:VWFA-related protein
VARSLIPHLTRVLAGPLLFSLPLISIPLSGQTNAALPPQRPDDQITTLHTSTNLVVIDVTVTDARQNPVHGLKQSDFTLMENNIPQRVKNFEEHVPVPASDSSKVVGPPKLPPGLFSNRAVAPANGPVNVILLDSLNTPLEQQPYVRSQLVEFVKKQPPGTRIAIFSLSSSLTMLQGFTSDPEVLKAALTGKTGIRQPSDLLVNTVTGGSPTDTTYSTLWASNPNEADGSDLSYAQALANVQRFEALQTAFQLQLRSKYTLDAFNLLARYLVGIPGRKNVIWFSASFPLDVYPNPALQDAMDSFVNSDAELRETDNLLTRAQVAVYPVDARGVYNVGAFTTDNFGNTTATDMQQFYQDAGTELETMSTMAEDTGGRVFNNTNNLTAAVTKAIEDGSNYYTLTYTPSDQHWDSRFRTIKVKLAQQGYSLTYRRGYYADDPEGKHTIEESAVAPSHPTTMATAMMRGGPSPSEILFKVRIRPSALPPEVAPAPGNKLNIRDPKAKNSQAPTHIDGPFQRYGLDYAPDTHAVSCPETVATHIHHCALEVATAVYDAAGVLINSTSLTSRVSLSAATYTKMLSYGIPIHQEISVPVKGNYFLRTAIHDLQSDHVGAVEVPVATVAKLPPLQSAPPASPTPPTATPADTPVPTPSTPSPDVKN